MSIYDIEVEDIDGNIFKLEKYKGKVLLIVNTASKCGFTPQYQGLQELYKKFGPDNFVILGFPCNQFASQEPLEDSGIKEFCSLNFGVTFPMFSKIDVNGENTHPLYKFLKEEQKGFLVPKIKWNFTKFLVDKNGKVISRFSPSKKPETLIESIEKLLK